MEQGESNHHEDDGNIPDDVSELVKSVYERDKQRQKAMLINLQNASAAESQEERDY